MVNNRGTNVVDCENKVIIVSKIAGTIRALVNAKELNLDYTIVLHKIC